MEENFYWGRSYKGVKIWNALQCKCNQNIHWYNRVCVSGQCCSKTWGTDDTAYVVRHCVLYPDLSRFLECSISSQFTEPEPEQAQKQRREREERSEQRRTAESGQHWQLHTETLYWEILWIRINVHILLFNIVSNCILQRRINNLGQRPRSIQEDLWIRIKFEARPLGV